MWTYLTCSTDLISSQESEDSQLPYKIGCDQLPIVKSTPTLERSYFLECQKANFQLPPFGMTLLALKDQIYKEPKPLWMGQQKLTSSTVASHNHAKTLALLIQMVKVWKASEADYFSRSCAWLMSYDHNLFSWRMSQISLLKDYPMSQEKLPSEGMIVDGKLYPLHKLEQSIQEIDGGYLPTLTATEGGWNKSQGANAIARPTLSTMVRKNLFPTLKARDGKDNGKSPSEARRNTPSLAHNVGGQLNPTWCEWFMGYPLGWSELKDWGMQLFRSARDKRSKI